MSPHAHVVKETTTATACLPTWTALQCSRSYVPSCPCCQGNHYSYCVPPYMDCAAVFSFTCPLMPMLSRKSLHLLRASLHGLRCSVLVHMSPHAHVVKEITTVTACLPTWTALQCSRSHVLSCPCCQENYYSYCVPPYMDCTAVFSPTCLAASDEYIST